MDQHEVIDIVLDTFASRGMEKYGVEAVTQLQHALQCAALARREKADESLIVAALLHDIGHILGQNDLPEDCETDLDDSHETRGHNFLLIYFGPSVAEPVQLHVAAKRYLCTRETDYKDQLSPTSWKSFLDQGGVMSEGELKAFESSDWFENAVRLRRWDDQAKDCDAEMPDIHEFVPLMHRLLAQNA